MASLAKSLSVALKRSREMRRCVHAAGRIGGRRVRQLTFSLPLRGPVFFYAERCSDLLRKGTTAAGAAKPQPHLAGGGYWRGLLPEKTELGTDKEKPTNGET